MARVTDAPNGNYTHYLDVNQESQSNSNNTSTVSYRYWVRRNFSSSYGSWSGSDTRLFRARVNGVNHDRNVSFDTRYGNDWTFVSGNQTISHNSDGYATISFSLYFEGWSSSFPSASSGNGSLTLDRIPKVPDAPVPIGIDQITATSMRYRFSAGDSNGASIVEWQIQRATNSSFTTGVSTISGGGTTTLSGLANHTRYWVRARGRNSQGWGAWSSSRDATTLGHPTAPLSLSGTPSPSVTGRVALSWSPPTTTGAGGIVGYTIYRDGAQIGTTTGTGTAYTDNGRTPFTSYSYRVAARNAYSTSVGGTGPQSTATAVVAQGPPSAPLNLIAVSDSMAPGKVDLDWDAPTNTGTGGITGYRIRLADGTLMATLTGTATSYSVTGLSPGVSYSFKVSGRNALSDAEGSEGAFSSSVGVTPVGEPTAPTGLTVTASPTASNRLVLSWNAPSGGLSGYNIFRRVSGGDTLVGSVNSSHTTYSIDGLTHGASYTYVVRARTAYTDSLSDGYPGNWGGPASAPATATATVDSAQSVPSLSAAASSTNVQLSGDYTVTAITPSTIRYTKIAGDIPSSISAGTITNLTNQVFNGTYSVSTPTPNTLTYAKTNSNIQPLATSGGSASNATNSSFNGTFIVTAVNVGANLLSYANPGADKASVAVPTNDPPGAFGTVTNLSNAVFNRTGRVISDVTATTLSYAQTGSDIAETNAAGVVVNTTNRDIFNGTYKILSLPNYNVVKYSRDLPDITPARTWEEPNGIVSRTTSPATLQVRFRSGWAG